jgi:putative ABC transport system permease protein
MSSVIHDFRSAVRSLIRTPAFTVAAVLTLAVGIGANTAIFSAVHAVLLRPLTVDALEDVIVVHADAPGLNLRRFPLTPISTFNLNKRRDLFEAVGGHYAREMILTGFGEPQLVRTASTAGDFFTVLRWSARIGRVYGADDSEPGRSAVAVVSHRYWQSAGGGASNFIGRRLVLNDRSYEVIGVMPSGSEYPKSADIWTPLPSDDRVWRPSSVLLTIARLRPDVALPRVEGELRAYADSWNAPKSFGMTIVTEPFIEHLAGTLRPVLLILFAAVGMVLLIACTNVASLQLVRATARAKEVALRTALGAGRGVLIRRLLTESLVVAAAGGAAGLALGHFVANVLRTWRPDAFPQLADLRLDPAVLMFTAAVSICSGVAVGLIPALRGSRQNLASALKASGRTASSDSKQHRLLNVFAAIQFALAFILLAGSVLLIRSFGELLNADPGFKPERLVSMTISLPSGPYTQPGSTAAFYRELQSRLSAVPGIDATALTTSLPLTEHGSSSPFQIVNRPAVVGEPQPHADALMVTPDYFRVMAIPMLRGRNFEPADARPSEMAVLVDAQLAREFFPGEDPIGKQIRHFYGRPATIVGVVGSVNQREVGGPSKATVYYFVERHPRDRVTLVTASSLDTAAVVSLSRAVVSQIEPGAAIANVRRVQEVVSNALAARELAMYVLTALGAVSLLLAVVGIYGVFSYTTTQRTQEIGVRLAIGATPGDVTAMVLRHAAMVIGAGLAIGVAGSLVLSGPLAALVYGVGPRDPLTLVLTLIVLVLAGLTASWLPAWRASRVSPIVALRYE